FLVLGGRDHRAGHDLASRQGLGRAMDLFKLLFRDPLSEYMGALKRREWNTALATGEVGLRDNADRFSGSTDDRHASDAVLQHRLGYLLQRRLRAHRDRRTRHEFSNAYRAGMAGFGLGLSRQVFDRS